MNYGFSSLNRRTDTPRRKFIDQTLETIRIHLGRGEWPLAHTALTAAEKNWADQSVPLSDEPAEVSLIELLLNDGVQGEVANRMANRIATAFGGVGVLTCADALQYTAEELRRKISGNAVGNGAIRRLRGALRSRFEHLEGGRRNRAARKVAMERRNGTDGVT